jgi:hypothetical protein
MRRKIILSVLLLSSAIALPIFVIAQQTTRPTVRNPHASLQHCRLAIGMVIKQATSRANVKIDGWLTERSETQLTIISIDPVTNSLKPTTARIDQQTEIIDRFRCYTAMNDMVIGDRVQLYASARTNGEAELIRNQNSWIVSMTGKVESPNPGSQTFTFVVGRHNRESIAQTRVDSLTLIERNGQRASFADLTNGTPIKMIARWNRTTQTFLAARIQIITPAPSAEAPAAL